MIIGAMLAALALAAEPGEAPAPTATPAATPAPAATPTATATLTPAPPATPSATAPSPDDDEDAAPASADDATPATSPDPGKTDSPRDDAPPLPTAPPGPALSDSPPVLLSRIVRARGRALERLIEPSGDVVEHEVNAAGTVLSCKTVGSLRTMRIVAQQPAAGGEFLQVARDTSGALVQFVVNAEGEPRAVALLAPGL